MLAAKYRTILRMLDPPRRCEPPRHNTRSSVSCCRRITKSRSCRSRTSDSRSLPQVAREFDLDFELVFVNDGSDDRTSEMLDQFSALNPHLRVVHLARNFGHQAAVSAGLNVAAGDVVAIMDCDLQDPPEVLPKFLSKVAQRQPGCICRTAQAEGMVRQAIGLLGLLSITLGRE